ncbi:MULTISPECIES: FAD-dependent oxidoreductase [unclassified Limnobacter]|uniref:NAD(P)/FAD-dependent oxidoreductase n=1 Tax=unclassified Limnobacter TaxID=2630203 RepID=UPI000C6342B3|nr:MULTISPECIES: FAD-dependent oxidoreductase [unclassified Limnobacter]MAZ09144.1 FAD-dependent oxidoreductase [Sutterellaceae bacterium]|tara:strand:- start:3986 stop:5128 length:1143 start_codon:yes stop_codon:yes gene_type:complete
MNTTIIGSGVAAWTLVRELRKADPEAEIRLITADSGDFYSKPMLSNALASGKTAESLVMTPAAKFADQQKVELVANTNVSSIDASTRKLASSAGEFSYDNLVLALGADTIKLPIEGAGAGDVVSVNDLNDYAEFRKLLDGKKEVAVLGAGLIGCEFANDLLKADIHTTVFDLADRPLARLLPEQASSFMQNKLAEKGVSWKLGRTVSSVVKNGAGYTLTDSTGETTQADLVLSAVGLKPRTELAKHANLDVSRGIVVNNLGQTSNKNIYALGDCAEYLGKFVLPYIMPVMQAARAMAQTLAGKPTEIKFPAMPVSIKTPDCPAVVNPPLPEHEGEWEITADENGVKALFKGKDGALLGMALLGEASKERQALTPQLPAMI